MLRSLIGRGARNESGAVASTVALSLFGLIAVGGLAFDYARMVSLDTELQQAADQAALAAVTQLDQNATSCTRAVAAARQLITNQTKFGNDGGGLTVAIANQSANSGCGAVGDKIKFYSAYASNASNTVTTDPLAAKFVSVTVATRQAVYALTPIMALFNSGNLSGTAVAGLGSAICKVPPVMMCNPSESLTNTDPNLPFDANALKGSGIRLLAGSATVPGNFGFLETGFGSGAANLARALGYNSPPGECLPQTGVTTKPGLNAVVINALNTRFDLDTNGANTCPAGGTCSPSRNVRKDLVKGNNCGTSGNQGWQEPTNPYLPTSATLPLTSGYPSIMGHPRDMCHAVSVSGSCSGGKIGNGLWDRDAYFRVNYGWTTQATWTTNTGLPANATRYQVYQWELTQTNVTNTGVADKNQAVNGKNGYSYPVCRAPGITPSANVVDRRRISVAVLNCHALGLNGSESNVPVLKWVDVFLAEPSFPRTRTSDDDVYVEMIGETTTGASGSTAGQVVRRDKPYLIE